eukprot:268706_1
MSEEKKYAFEQEIDNYNEVLIDPNNDRRMIICDSQNKRDTIIECIGSIESQYIPDAKLKQTEKMHGTGTVIHINEQNNVYVLSAAHNILAIEKQCEQCQTKTLTSKCPNMNCGNINKTIKTDNLIKPTHIYFDRRAHNNCTKYTLGESIDRYQIEKYECHSKYYTFPSPKSGYDMCILIFTMKDQSVIDLYSQICSNISLINDETFGNHKCVMHIFGYPGEKRKKKNYRVYYYLFGMSTSKIDSTNKFKVNINIDTHKSYIVNKGIDTTVGQSGSCIYAYNNNDSEKYLIYGIHCGGSQKLKANYGTFLDVDNIEWIANILDDSNGYFQNVFSNKFMICHYGLVMSRMKQLKTQNNALEAKNKELKQKNWNDCLVEMKKFIDFIKNEQCLLMLQYSIEMKMIDIKYKTVLNNVQKK